MAVVDLNKKEYSKNRYNQVIDTSFTQLVNSSVEQVVETQSISVDEFFNNYQEIFFQIPKFGEVNSHEYLAKTSQEYIGDTNNNDETIQALIDEITQLRQENLELNQRLADGGNS